MRDDDFSGLRWLPWVGKHYDKTKFLIVGRNHHDADDEDRNFTRKFVCEQGICGHHTTPFIDTLHEIIVDDEMTKEQLWSSVAFHNLVLRSVPDNCPTDDDMCKGWKSLKVLIKTLKPTFCLVCFTSRKYVDHAFPKNRRRKILNGAYPKIACFGETLLAFIRTDPWDEPEKVNPIEWSDFLTNDPDCKEHFVRWRNQAKQIAS